jgi:hypothetical protein
VAQLSEKAAFSFLLVGWLVGWVSWGGVFLVFFWFVAGDG